MLRLDLKDKDSTVLFIEPEKGITIRKGKSYELWLEVGGWGACCTEYYSEESRNAAYDYAVHKIKEYLFSKGCLCKEV